MEIKITVIDNATYGGATAITSDTSVIRGIALRPVPVKDLKVIDLAVVKAVGKSGREEEAVLTFDLRRNQFVLRQVHIDPDGFQFDATAVEDVTTDAGN